MNPRSDNAIIQTKYLKKMTISSTSVVQMAAVCIDEVRRFMEESLVAAGAPLEEAKAHADLLLHADIVGHFSHGLNRLGEFLL